MANDVYSMGFKDGIEKGKQESFKEIIHLRNNISELQRDLNRIKKKLTQQFESTRFRKKGIDKTFNTGKRLEKERIIKLINNYSKIVKKVPPKESWVKFEAQSEWESIMEITSNIISKGLIEFLELKSQINSQQTNPMHEALISSSKDGYKCESKDKKTDLKQGVIAMKLADNTRQSPISTDQVVNPDADIVQRNQHKRGGSAGKGC